MNIEITKEDAMNIAKWLTATGMMVEAGVRVPLSQSEHDTWAKFQPIYHSSTIKLTSHDVNSP